MSMTMGFYELMKHKGHDIVCVAWGDPPVTVRVECDTCHVTLLEVNKPITQ
jgi:hypothetical protein